RFEHDPPAYVVVGISHETGTAVGTRRLLAEGLASTEVYRTGRPARRGAVDWAPHAGPAAGGLLWLGVPPAVPCPALGGGKPVGRCDGERRKGATARHRGTTRELHRARHDRNRER